MLDRLAQQHFSDRGQRAPFVHSLVQYGGGLDAFAAIESNVELLQRLGIRRLTGDVDRIREGLHGTPGVRIAVLKLLRRDNSTAVGDEEVTRLVLDNLQHDDRAVRLAAVETLAVRYPERITEAVPLLQTEGDAAARLMAISAEPALAFPLLAWAGFPHVPPPPYIGFVLNPEWLAEEFNRNAKSARELITRYGYADDDATDVTRAWLARGAWYVGPTMRDAGVHKDALQRIRDFTWSLLPDDLGLESNRAVDVDSPVDVELFFAAVREFDARQLLTIRERDPFAPRRQQSPRLVVCAHAHARYVRQILLTEPLRVADRLEIPGEYRGRFLIDSARVLLEPNEERRIEADLELRSRYVAMRRTNEWFSPQTMAQHRPVVSDADFPFAKCAVVDSLPAFSDSHELSAGASAISRLAQLVGVADCADALRESEALWGEHLKPVGCEWQIPHTDLDRQFAWQQVLRAMRIPSPRRPEYRTLLEVAPPPAASWHACALVPMLLMDCGVIAEPQDLAMHISIEGDVGEDARYIAFLQTFLNNSRRLAGRPSRFSRRVMSKGLVCCNPDVTPCRPNDQPTCRTEFRMFGAYIDDDGPPERRELGLNLSYVDDIASTCLLASAFLSDDAKLKSLAANFRRDVRQYLAELPPVFTEYFESNFHAATGDADDPGLHEFIPVYRLRREVRNALDVEIPQADVVSRCRQLLAHHCRQISDAIVGRKQQKESSNRTPCGIPWNLPSAFSRRCLANVFRGAAFAAG